MFRAPLRPTCRPVHGATLFLIVLRQTIRRCVARLMPGLSLGVLAASSALADEVPVLGRVLDPQGGAVAAASMRLQSGTASLGPVRSDAGGQYRFDAVPPGSYRLTADAAGFQKAERNHHLGQRAAAIRCHAVRCRKPARFARHQRLSGRAVRGSPQRRGIRPDPVHARRPDDATTECRNRRGQHEGGGKSLEIRRFGFNLDHGGVNGGLKVLVDDVEQNQGTQGHGQGYLGALKALSPELIEDVTIINGPFRAEYGDFSGLGVVHIRQRESLPEQFTARLEAGNFHTGRGFLAYSPDVANLDAYLAYEGSYTDGPFQSPGRYRRDNLNANYTNLLSKDEKLGFRFLFGRNDFYSSGQIPLDLVNAGLLDRFGFIDPSDGGRVKLGTASAYYSRARANGDTFKADSFLSRSLFDLYSNFTFYLNDPVNGDAFQQHDSRLQEGFNAQYTHAHHLGSLAAVLSAGGNFHDNQINVGLYPRDGRVPTGVTTRANAHVTNAAGYAQENVSLDYGKLLLGGRHPVRRIPLRRARPGVSARERC